MQSHRDPDMVALATRSATSIHLGVELSLIISTLGNTLAAWESAGPLPVSWRLTFVMRRQKHLAPISIT